MSNELGRWIERERIKRGWSQRRLAQEAGISQAPISRIINKVPKDQNEQICGEKVAKALAQAMGANTVYVFRLARILKPPARSRNFSTWLVGELLLRHMTQEELSKKADLDEDLVNEITRGVPPTFEIADKLADALGFDHLYIQQLAGLLPPGEQALSPSEIDLINDYRELNIVARQVVQDLISSLHKNMT